MEISKRQFIVITIIVILVTFFIVIGVYNSKKNNKDITNPNANNKNTSVSDTNNNVLINNQEEENIDTEEENIDVETPKKTIEQEINTTSKGAVLSAILTKIESEGIYDDMTEPTKDESENYFGLDVAMFDEYLIRISKNRYNSELYMIFKPSDGSEADALAQIKKFLLKYENSWRELDFKQYNLIAERKAVKRNGYLIYIISQDNEAVLDVIREFIKE